MNTGQMLMSLGALLLLSLTVLRVNNSIITSDSVMMDSKFGVLATSLATSLIEKANKKAFDANSAEDAVSSLTQLTAPNGLGPSSTENPPDDCNDFDDFDEYTELVTNLPSAEFLLSCDVSYVNPNNLDGVSSNATWHKKMTVTVTSPSTTDTIRVSTVYSYWYFR
jgi:MSHA pilin protein MshD